jgi:DNA-binding GntR family transcriptional regulator
MPLPNSIDRIDRQLIRERVYDTLRDWIVRGLLEPNEKMRDVELADRLGVSRTPVREALRRLEDEGLVQTQANRWTRVSPVDVEDARRLYPILWSLECLAARLAGPRLEARDLDEMAQANDRLAQALSGKNATDASAADRDFHQIFVRRSGNPELIKIIEDLKVKMRRLENAYFGGPLVAQRSVAEHKRILNALRKKDVEGTVLAVEDNWRNSLDRIAASSPTLRDGPNGRGSPL